MAAYSSFSNVISDVSLFWACFWAFLNLTIGYRNSYFVFRIPLTVRINDDTEKKNYVFVE